MLEGRSVDQPRRAAIALLGRDAPTSERTWALRWLTTEPPERFVRALVCDHVDQLFLRRSEEDGLVRLLPEALVSQLFVRRLTAAATALLQRQVLGEVSALFEEFDVEYVVLKGLLLRHILYSDPYLRPAVDIDLLVSSSVMHKVARAFQARGYRMSGRSHSDTHELSVGWRGVSIDLHWHLLRPGRMRMDLAEEVLANRVFERGVWGPSEVHQTAMMLVHPAITEYVTGHLVHAVDLDEWLRTRKVPWKEVVALLGRMGLKTAGWAMLAWTMGLFLTPVPAEDIRELVPGLLRRRYLQAWISRHPSQKYERHPGLVRTGFSLPLHDRVSDAVRALARLARKERIRIEPT